MTTPLATGYGNRIAAPKTERELSHYHRGVGIYYEGIGYLAEWDGHSVFSNRWWTVERKIDELKGKNN